MSHIGGRGEQIEKQMAGETPNHGMNADWGTRRFAARTPAGYPKRYMACFEGRLSIHGKSF